MPASLESNLDQQKKLFLEQSCSRLKSDQAELGFLVAAATFKRTLVRQLGVEDAFTACRQHLNVPGLDILKPRKVVSLMAAARRVAIFNELWPAGRTFVHCLKRVCGESDHVELRSISRSGYLTCLDDIVLRGRSAVVMTESEAIVDYENDELSRFEDIPEQEPGILYAADDIYWTMDPQEDSLVVEEAFMLSGSHANDFGHWLHEYLPKLAIALIAGLPEVPILVDERMPRTHIQSLELFCPASRIIVIPHLASCRVGKLWCASNPTYRGWYPSDWTSAWEGMTTDPDNFATTINKLKELATEAIEAPTGSDRIFLARRHERKKKLINHLEIEAVAANLGFTVVYPEDLPFVEQMRLAHHARYIIAPDGSNGLVSYFASAGAKVCFLNHAHTMPLAELDGILGALGVEFTALTGPIFGEPKDEPFWNDYLIDGKKFAAFLDQWLAQ